MTLFQVTNVRIWCVCPCRRMKLRPGALLLISVWVGVWSVPIERNDVELEAKEEVQEETEVSVFLLSYIYC